MHLNQEFHSIYPQVLKEHERELQFSPAGFLFECDATSCEALLAEHFTGLTVAPPAPGARGFDFSGGTWAEPLANEFNKTLRENPFSYYRRPYPPDQRTWSVFVLREVSPFTYPGGEQGFFDRGFGLPGSGVQLIYNNQAGWELEFQVWPRQLEFSGPFGDSAQLAGTIYGFYSEDTLGSTDPYELEARDDEYARWHQVYSVKGDVSLGVEDPEMLTADIEFGIELKQPQREIPFFIQSKPQRSATGSDKTSRASCTSTPCSSAAKS
jgi:hypothetical protein